MENDEEYLPQNCTKNKIVKRDIGYVSSKKLCQQLSKVEKILNRSFMLHSLMFHTGVLKEMKLFDICMVKMDELKVFHSSDYLNFLADPKPSLEEEFGCVYDCPVFDGMEEFARTIVSASLTAARLLLEDRVHTAINWSGGWHHARRDTASGFCYVNDVVLAIHKLQSRFKRILYIDLDVHHGDAVEDAFSSTSKVMTLSLHKMEPGFFPGSGSVSDIGFGKGKCHSVNVPLKHGIKDQDYCHIFDQVFDMTLLTFNPDVFVLQCGVDGLAGDPHGGFNLTPEGLSHCVTKVVSAGPPCLLLGGGGYHIANSVRCWTKITADLVGVELPQDIPDTDPHFLQYGPDFTFRITPSCSRNMNTTEQVQQLLDEIRINMSKIEF